jgi:hypothetical protein
MKPIVSKTKFFMILFSKNGLAPQRKYCEDLYKAKILFFQLSRNYDSVLTLTYRGIDEDSKKAIYDYCCIED